MQQLNSLKMLENPEDAMVSCRISANISNFLRHMLQRRSSPFTVQSGTRGQQETPKKAGHLPNSLEMGYLAEAVGYFRRY